MKPSWIQPLYERQHSGASNMNFLWQQGNVFIMDNHRAALWCWLQFLESNKRYNLFHIDEHTDTLRSNLEIWKEHLPSLEGISFQEYLKLNYEAPHGTQPLITWDNYLSLFLDIYRKNVGHCIFATHGVGDPPQTESLWNVDINDIPQNLKYWFSQKNEPWIVNIDLDYFFCDFPNGREVMVSESYLRTVFHSFKELLSSGSIEVLTLCLTPCEELTGGWEKAEKLCEQVCDYLDIDFSLQKM